MIFRERITVYIKVLVGVDSMGNDKYETRPTPARANVTPLGAEQWTAGPQVFTGVRYRVVIAPDIDIPATGGLSIDWRGLSKIPSDGAVERHYVGGRLHHYEMTSKLMS